MTCHSPISPPPASSSCSSSSSAAPLQPLPKHSHVGLIMGSLSDREVMTGAAQVLNTFGIGFEWRVVSAHRTPQYMHSYALAARDRGIKVLIAGAGGAAHLPGMVASLTTIPVIGVPISLKNLSGWDSLLSIVSMPRGVPVATVAVDGAANAAWLAIRILAIDNPALTQKLQQQHHHNAQQSLKNDQMLQNDSTGSHQASDPSQGL